MKSTKSFSARRAYSIGLVTAPFLLLACGGSSSSSGDATTSSSVGAGGEGGSGGGSGAGGAGGAGGSGGGEAAIWEWCPKADAYVGDPSWTGTIEVKEAALYCATFDEQKTLEQTLATKAQLRFIPGTYKAPTEAAAKKIFSLPYCVRFLADGTQPLVKGNGSLTADFPVFEGTTSYDLRYNQPMQAGTDAWEADIRLQGPWDPKSPAPLTLNGEFNDATSQTNQSLSVCKGDCTSFEDVRYFNSCTAEGASTHLHTIVFEGGKIELKLRIGHSFASTEPGAFIQESGELDGTAFDQKSYWKLIYVPEHHHFSRNFAVLFDAPIGKACGIKAQNVYSDTLERRLTTINCDLSEIEQRKILSEDYQKTP